MMNSDEGDNGNDMRNTSYRGRGSEISEQQVAAAAAEATRKLEREKAKIQAEAKKREDELMNTIRQQQQQLQRLQQAAALAEQKAKVFQSCFFQFDKSGYLLLRYFNHFQ